MFSKSRLSLLVPILAAASLASGVALAQTPAPAVAPAPAPTPESTLTANVGIFSQYGFRGIAQTGGQPALQGGLDYAHTSGFYVGTWASNISWLEDFGLYNRSSLEWDFYGGYKSTFPGSEDWTYDVGVLYYLYPGRKNSGVLNANTVEGYGAIGWKWVSAKASYSFQNYFGIEPTGQKTNGTWYIDFTANYPFGESGFTLLTHYGILDVRHDGSGNSKASYNDWRVGLSYVVPEGLFKSVEIGGYYTGNSATEAFYTDLTGYNTAKDAGIVYVKKTF
ncbi:MAG: TorF family putative porin [Casimicrobiaceae bacterium]